MESPIVFVRAFHFSWKVLLYLFCFLLFLFFFSCQKKKSSFQILSKNFLVYHVILLKRCSHITLLEWTLTRYRVIGPCAEILVISQSPKAHDVHAWKFMYNETYISWWSSAFVCNCNTLNNTIESSAPTKLNLNFATWSRLVRYGDTVCLTCVIHAVTHNIGFRYISCFVRVVDFRFPYCHFPF